MRMPRIELIPPGQRKNNPYFLMRWIEDRHVREFSTRTADPILAEVQRAKLFIRLVEKNGTTPLPEPKLLPKRAPWSITEPPKLRSKRELDEWIKWAEGELERRWRKRPGSEGKG